ncbi:MAG: VanZ family protein [Butyrivibrio sp.]|nr:VanZ family protein [Acetatifactor muris]MCM1561245.1 VanZ family protein [Butyrivibrio sp.]
MIEYIDADISRALGYLPYGLAVGIPVAAAAVWLANAVRKKKRKPPVRWVPVTAFCVYMAVLLVITFLSRESGSRSDVLDLELFSTWGINDRNNAFVIENVLLFIPYGLFYCWNSSERWKLLRCTFLGAVISLGIETMQLVTGRGYFQIDDIVTNTLGAFLGALLYMVLWGLNRVFRNPGGSGDRGGDAE